jgi:hypothetical protein
VPNFNVRLIPIKPIKDTQFWLGEIAYWKRMSVQEYAILLVPNKKIKAKEVGVGNRQRMVVLLQV